MIPTPNEYRNMEFRELLIILVKLFKPKVYCEFGVKKGYTFNAIAPLVEKAIGVDIIESPVVKLPNVQFYKMRTTLFESMWFSNNGEKIDFLFIDADHSFKAIITDISLMTRHLNPFTSLVFLHDTYPIKPELLAHGYCNDAWRAAREIKSWKDFEIVTLPGPWAGLSILRYVPYESHGWMDREYIY